MNEIDAMKLWSKKRSEMIKSQMGPTFLLTVLVYLSATVHLDTLGSHTKLFIAVSTAVVGIFGIFNQMSISRDGKAVVEALSAEQKKGPLAQSIINSDSFFQLTGMLVNILGVVVYAVLLYLLYK